MGSVAGRDHRRRTSTTAATPREATCYTTYSAAEIDAVAAYCQELKRCYWLPIDLVEGKRAM